MKTAIKIQDRDGEFGNVWELANGSQIEQRLGLNNRDRFGVATSDSRLVTEAYDVEIENGTVHAFEVYDYGTAAKAKAAAYSFAKSRDQIDDQPKVFAKDLKRGDFIVCCDEWENGRTVLGSYLDCGEVRLVFRVAGSSEIHHADPINWKSKVAISRVFSDRFKR
jgi:hypothetical protein